ncbi:MAG: hypothetical protein JST28_03350 [Acidobacteria bacterium]|nr:hypothetical protein [Acidobacteriota bacterium]
MGRPLFKPSDTLQIGDGLFRCSALGEDRFQVLALKFPVDGKGDEAVGGWNDVGKFPLDEVGRVAEHCGSRVPFFVCVEPLYELVHFRLEILIGEGYPVFVVKG